MTRRLTRHDAFELSLNIHKPEFARTPRAAQLNWLLNRIMKEASDELVHLDDVASSLVPGRDSALVAERAISDPGDEDIMEDWQIPVMKKMAQIAAQRGGDVLEVGFGRGVSAEFIQEYAPRSHTAIECNDAISKRFDAFRQRYPERTISLIQGLWQDVVDQLSKYDGILFHTYPLSDDEFVETVVKSDTFAEHFFETAASLLKPGGVLTYLSNEPDSLSRGHQRALFRHFSSFRLSMLHDLEIPDHSQDALWRRQLVMVEVTR